MLNDKLMTTRSVLARVPLRAAGVLAIALIAAGAVSQAQAARLLPLPRVTAETYEIDFQGRRAVVLHTLLLRSIRGTPEVTCNRCLRFATRKVQRSSPSRSSRRYRHADWILRGGRAVKIKVTRSGWIGRYLLLTAQRRKGGLGYKASGCLNRRGMKIHCPTGAPKPPTPLTVPVSPPPTLPPTTMPPAPDPTVVSPSPAPTVIDLNGRWTDGGTPALVISVHGTDLTIDMSAHHRPAAHGSIIDSQTISVTFPDDATYSGTLQAPGTIKWSNGTAWTKAPAAARSGAKALSVSPA